MQFFFLEFVRRAQTVGECSFPRSVLESCYTSTVCAFPKVSAGPLVSSGIRNHFLFFLIRPHASNSARPLKFSTRLNGAERYVPQYTPTHTHTYPLHTLAPTHTQPHSFS